MADDPFACFDDVPPDATTDVRMASSCESGTKRQRVGPSPILPLVRRHAAMHLDSIGSALNASNCAAASALSVDLAAAIACMQQDPHNLTGCRDAAQRVAEQAWATLRRDKAWPSPAWREAYVLSQLLLACACAEVDDDEAGALCHLDRAFILGGPSTIYRDCAELLESDELVHSNAQPYKAPSAEEREAVLSRMRSQIDRPAMRTVERCPCPSSSSAFQRQLRDARPLVIEGLADDWPACRRWSDFHWLREQYGARLVPIEVGSLAGDGTAQQHGWRESMTPLAEFLDTYMLATPPIKPVSRAAHPCGAENRTDTGEIGYLAQHALFDQFPRLRRDFSLPAFCGSHGAQHVNAWLGPCGTVTPLHFDSYDNVLTQVVGYKFVRLYDATQTRYLYPKSGAGADISAQGNLSSVDVESPDYARYPEFAHATGMETLLGPGEGLFIPAGCWHHVRSLTPSFSVSIWF